MEDRTKATNKNGRREEETKKLPKEGKEEEKQSSKGIIPNHVIQSSR
jgi:hypothetical protein